MTRPNLIKTSGYGISVLSVVLLGVTSFKNASKDTNLMVCLVLGMIASIVGMGLRWWSYQADQKS